jgi:hypothetical protein
VLTMVKHILSDAHPRRKKVVKERRKINKKEQ